MIQANDDLVAEVKRLRGEIQQLRGGGGPAPPPPRRLLPLQLRRRLHLRQRVPRRVRDILDRVEAHDRWRLEECLNLQPSENVTSPQVRRILASDLGHRYTLPWKGEIHGAWVENAYGGTRYLDEIEATGEGLPPGGLPARFASAQPPSGDRAGGG